MRKRETRFRSPHGLRGIRQGSTQLPKILGIQLFLYQFDNMILPMMAATDDSGHYLYGERYVTTPKALKNREVLDFLMTFVSSAEECYEMQSYYRTPPMFNPIIQQHYERN